MMKTKSKPIENCQCLSRLTVLRYGLNRPKVVLENVARTCYASTPVQLPTGDIVYQSKEVVLNTAEKLSKFRVFDFSINSLRLSGAINNLKPTKMKGDSFRNLDNIETALDKLSSSAPENNVPTNVES